MDKDMACLRDLWGTIDPESPIGCESALSRETREREANKEKRKVAKALATAREKAKEAARQGRQVDRRTAHFLQRR
jgi:hypothetical protein